MLTITFIIVILTKSDHSPVNPFIAYGSNKSILVQAVNNFHNIFNGTLTPSSYLKNKDEIKNFLTEKSNFEPFIPIINDYELYGCICNEFDGEKIVQLIYKSGDDIIYLYQASINAINNNKLEVPEPVNNHILNNKYYICDNVDDMNCVLLIWYMENILCASVSNIPKNTLLTKFEYLK